MDSDDFSDDSTTSEEEEEYESYMDESNFNEKLIESVINEDYEEVEKYLQHGANPNTTDYRGITPLNYAVMSDDSEESIDIIRILLEYGAQINFKENTSFGNTALMVAALYNYDVVKYLLERGADPFLVNNKGNTAYDNAIQNGNMKIAILLKHYMMVYKMQRRRRRNLTHRRTRTEAATRNLAMARMFEDLDVDDPLTHILRRETLRSIYG
tara:strand:- start:15 stop:650 length:636 start_codon:yes stop_codon:yes gene_type:complete